MRRVLSRLQTQQQLYHSSGAQAHVGIAQSRAYGTVREVASTTLGVYGPMGFYRGLSPYLLFSFPRGVSRFVTYEYCNNHLLQLGVQPR